MKHMMTAATIRQASLGERLPIAMNYRRASQNRSLTAQQRSFLRLAARFVLGNVDSPGYDVMARLQLLEAASGQARMGPNAGTWWKKGRRGLKMAEDAFAGTDIDPSWLSTGNTGLISKVYAMIQRQFQDTFRGKGSFSSADDIIQNGMMGLTKDGMGTLSAGPLFIHAGAMMNKGMSLYKKIVSGKETPMSIAGVVGKSFAKKVLDEAREIDRTTRRVPDTTPGFQTGPHGAPAAPSSVFDLLPSQASGLEFWDFLVGLLGSRSTEGRKLESKMRALANGQELANELIDRLVENKDIGSISKLHKDMGGSGSGGAVRWIKSTFIPAVQKMVQTDKDLLSAFRQQTRRQASKQGLASDIFDQVIGNRNLGAIMQVVKKYGDKQSGDLLLQIRAELVSRFSVDDSTERAINRLLGLTTRGKTWDPSLIRNNVFKVANELGIKLPSGMFASTKTAAIRAEILHNDADGPVSIFDLGLNPAQARNLARAVAKRFRWADVEPQGSYLAVSPGEGQEVGLREWINSPRRNKDIEDYVNMLLEKRAY